MKKSFAVLLAVLFSFSLFAEGGDEAPNPEEGDLILEVQAAKGGLSEVPPAKRPRAIDLEKTKEAAAKDESPEDEENHKNTIRYGIPSEIGELLDDLIKNEDPRFTQEIYDLFQATRSWSIREKVLKYFTKLEDPCLEDFAVNLLNDPYDERNEVVKASFLYIQAVKTKAAVPAVITLIESENENYFNDAIVTLGDIGGSSEAMFLVEYLDRDDLSDAQRQALMRTCGKMHAIQTWDKLVDILENEDENTFVRMYAAESIGLMKTEKSVPVLVKHFSESDPNLRQYVIKGLSNFPDNEEAKAVLIEAIRDEHWKVRQEAIKASKENQMKSAVPYLIYRAKNDNEKVIKEECFTTIANLNTKEGNDFLISQITDKKVGDANKKKCVEVLLNEGNAGEKEILELAKTCATDDKKKDLRYAIGKELAKKPKASYSEVCSLYLKSSDATTISLGLDMYKNFRFSDCEKDVLKIAEDKKNSNNKKRARKLLNLEDEVEEKKSEPAKKSTSTSNQTSADAK